MVERSRRRGFSMLPHHAITDPDLSDREFRLLCWLHSHDPEYLAKLSAASIADQFGGGTRTRTESLAALERKGYITVKDPARKGGRKQVTLCMDSWERVVPDRDMGGVPLKDKGGVPQKDSLVVPLKDNIEEQEKIKEKNTERPQVPFERFWEKYPRKEAKKAAEGSWAKLGIKDQTEVIKRLPAWLSWQRKEQADEYPKFLPYPATFLNQRRWEDEVTAVKDDDMTGAAFAPKGVIE